MIWFDEIATKKVGNSFGSRVKFSSFTNLSNGIGGVLPLITFELDTSMGVLSENLQNLPKAGLAFAAKFANLRAIVASVSYRKFRAAVAGCERLSFLV
jgi:hypothetical protein